MDSPLKFLVFYAILIFFVSYLSAMAGLDIFANADGMQQLIDEAPDQGQNPLWYFGVLTAMMSVSTEFTLIYVIIVVPFIFGLAYIILEKVIDLIPG